MRSLNLPTYSFKIKSDGEKNYIFDAFRKKYVILTPEEWVRQNFAQFLVQDKKFPSGRMVIEKSLKYNRLAKRCDILVYNNKSEPAAMIECKAPEVKIHASVFDQIAVYNMTFKVRFLIVTNGLEHYCAEIDLVGKKVKFLDHIPMYGDLLPEG